MTDFVRKFENALEVLGYPFGAFAYDLASMPLPPDGDFDELLRFVVGQRTEEE